MKEHVMKLDYTKTFKRIIVLFVLLAVVTAVAIPLSLSQQISDAAALKQEYALAKQTAADAAADNAVDNGSDKQDGEHDHEHDRDREEDMWKSRITPLNAVNYAIIGGLGVLWAVLVIYYWLAVRRAALQERREREDEQIPLADTRNFLQHLCRHGILHRARQTGKSVTAALIKA